MIAMGKESTLAETITVQVGEVKGKKNKKIVEGDVEGV
jgi:hypothetical protein